MPHSSVPSKRTGKDKCRTTQFLFCRVLWKGTTAPQSTPQRQIQWQDLPAQVQHLVTGNGEAGRGLCAASQIEQMVSHSSPWLKNIELGWRRQQKTASLVRNQELAGGFLACGATVL